MENREENSICNKTRKAQKNYKLWLRAATSNEICTKLASFLRRHLHLTIFHVIQSPYNQRGLKDANNDSACNKHVWREWRAWECYHWPLMLWRSRVRRQDEESEKQGSLSRGSLQYRRRGYEWQPTSIANQTLEDK